MSLPNVSNGIWLAADSADMHLKDAQVLSCLINDLADDIPAGDPYAEQTQARIYCLLTALDAEVKKARHIMGEIVVRGQADAAAFRQQAGA